MRSERKSRARPFRVVQSLETASNFTLDEIENHRRVLRED